MTEKDTVPAFIREQQAAKHQHRLNTIDTGQWNLFAPDDRPFWPAPLRERIRRAFGRAIAAAFWWLVRATGGLR